MSVFLQMGQMIAEGIQTNAVLQRQKLMYREQARQAEAEAAADAATIARRGRRIQAAAIARAGAGGVSDSPSVLDVLIDNAREIGLDIATTKYRGAMAAWGLREGEHMANWAQRWNILTGFGKVGAAAALGYDKYRYQREDSRTRTLEATKENFFTNKADYDFDSSGYADYPSGGYGTAGGDWGEPGDYGGWES